MDNSKKYIEQFIGIIKGKYNDLYVDYDYNSELDLFEIWHNDYELQFNNHEFLVFAGEMIKDILCKNNIYNFYFGYDYYKSTMNLNYNYLSETDNQSVIVSIKSEQVNLFEISCTNKKDDNIRLQPEVRFSMTQKRMDYVYNTPLNNTPFVEYSYLEPAA